MKTLYYSLICLVLSYSTLLSQTTILLEDFEDSTFDYSFDPISGECSDGNTVFVNRINSAAPPTGYNISNVQGNFYFAAQNTDGSSCGSVSYTLSWSSIDVKGFTGLTFSGLFAEDDASDGLEDWDDNSEVIVEAKLDNAVGYTRLITFAASGGTDSDPRVDTNSDNIGDGTALTSTLSNFSASIPGTGNFLDLRITISNLSADDEDISFDDIKIEGTPTPIVTFTQSSSTVTEESTTQNITIDLTNFQGVDVIVNVADLETGTAEAGGTDYTFVDQALTFTADGTQSVPVTIVEDTDNETDETIELGFTIVTTGPKVIILEDTHTITIDNDDLPPCIEIIGFNSDDPDEIVVRATEDLPSGSIYYLTDKEWNSGDSTFSVGENIATWTVPTEGIADESIIEFTGGIATCGSISGTLPNLSIDGEEVYITTADPNGMVMEDEICFSVKFNGTGDLPTLENGLDLGNIDNGFLTDLMTDITTLANWTTSDNVLTLPSPNCQLLPIELTQFEAFQDNDFIQLQWQTASEINNDYITIERSYNGNQFEEIGRVLGAGNTLIPQVYQFTDESPFNGFNYYRLKQVDFDGSYEYSDAIVVEIQLSASKLLLHSSLINDQLFIQLSDEEAVNGFIQIYNLSGQLMFETYSGNQRILQLNVTNYPAGHYLVTLVNNGNKQTARFLKN
ncbi:MAG: Calx-beta domain-containing protein [Bacteroidota bacterium]